MEHSRLTLPLGLAVAGLVLLVITSYIQTILHYPQGGGSYIVSKDNLGTFPSLVAAAALLTDYILTVSVSVSAGVRAVTSAFPGAYEYRVWIALGAILFITWMNLRGMRESGTVFAIPTYAFVGGVLVVILIGLARYFDLFGAAPIPVTVEAVAAESSLTGLAYLWLLLRAFAGGCTALTGIEAISDGVQAFKPPESKNAAITMVAMGVMAMSLFLGITFLATHLSLVPREAESILSQLTRQVTGRGFMYYWVQVFTALILFLAANTGYQDFPRLGYFLARDGFLSRWMQERGDRLVFSSGIVVLAVASSLLVIIFKADEIAMLPLYAIGVMLGFSLSQAGMFRLMGKIAHLKPSESIRTEVTEVHYERRVRLKQALNALGAVVTFVVFIILTATKFLEGAWVIVLLIPLMVTAFYSIHRHYERVAASLSTTGLTSNNLADVAEVVFVPIADLHKGSIQAIRYAKRISKDVRVLTICTTPEAEERFMRRWNRFPEMTADVLLVVIEYDFRDILKPLVDYIAESSDIEFPELITTVVVPEFIPENSAAGFLHNQTARRLRARLRQHRNIVVIDVPYHIDSMRTEDA